MSENKDVFFKASKIMDDLATSLIIDLPFLADVIASLHLIAIESEYIPLVALGDDCIFYNPSGVIAKSSSDKERLKHAFLHVYLHALFGHHLSSFSYSKSEAYDFTCDCIVENVIRKMNYIGDHYLDDNPNLIYDAKIPSLKEMVSICENYFKYPDSPHGFYFGGRKNNDFHSYEPLDSHLIWHGLDIKDSQFIHNPFDESGTVVKKNFYAESKEEPLPAFKVLSDYSGRVYFKTKDFGDYQNGSFSSSIMPSNYVLFDPIGFAYETHASLKDKTKTAFIECLDSSFSTPIPYYPIKEDIFKEVGANYRIRFNPNLEFRNNETPNEENIERFLARYSLFTNEKYTNLPFDIKPQLIAILTKEGIYRGDINAVEKVKSFLQSKYIYDMKFPPLPEGEDPCLYFLNVSKRGICQHFAMAATLLYRALGIPARYCHGFVASLLEGKETIVSSDQYHAYVEVWMEAFGWQKVEVTGYEDCEHEDDDTREEKELVNMGDGRRLPKNIADIINKMKQENKEPIDWNELVESVSRTLKRGIGRESCDIISRILDIQNARPYSYKELLKKYLVRGEAMKVDMDSFDYIYYTYGLKEYGNVPLIENLEYKDEGHIDNLVIAIDTSGSTYEDLVKDFLIDSYRAFSDMELRGKRFELHIIQIDSEVKADYKITSEKDFLNLMKEFHLVGNGGTDILPLFSYIEKEVKEKHMKQPVAVLYFTDGELLWPKVHLPYDLIAAISDFDYNFDFSMIPDNVIKLAIRENTLERIEINKYRKEHDIKEDYFGYKYDLEEDDEDNEDYDDDDEEIDITIA